MAVCSEMQQFFGISYRLQFRGSRIQTLDQDINPSIFVDELLSSSNLHVVLLSEWSIPSTWGNTSYWTLHSRKFIQIINSINSRYVNIEMRRRIDSNYKRPSGINMQMFFGLTQGDSDEFCQFWVCTFEPWMSRTIEDIPLTV